MFERFGSCGDLVVFGGFNSVFEYGACDDFGEVVKAAHPGQKDTEDYKSAAVEL